MLLWAPFVVWWFMGFLWGRRKHLPGPSLHAIAVLLSIYMVLATCTTTFIMFLVEYAHEDTVFADGFSLWKWRQLRSGMTRSEVHALLGEPLRGHCSFAPSAECWVANFSAGHLLKLIDWHVGGQEPALHDCPILAAASEDLSFQ